MTEGSPHRIQASLSTVVKQGTPHGKLLSTGKWAIFAHHQIARMSIDNLRMLKQPAFNRQQSSELNAVRTNESTPRIIPRNAD